VSASPQFAAGPLPSYPPAVARRVLAGAFLSGLLLSFLGAVLPAWGYHRVEDYITVGNYFICLNLGILLGSRLAFPFMRQKGIQAALVVGSALPSVGIFGLALASPPAPWAFRGLGMLLIGAGAGLLNCGVLEGIGPTFDRDRATTVNLLGTLFGLGCMATSLIVAGAFYVYTVPSILFFLAVIPVFYIGFYTRMKPPALLDGHQPRLGEALAELRSPGVALFALLLFFQFGNEWSLAGWLPLFLIQRLGLNPETALHMLSFYWLCLLVGRLAVQALLPRVPHGRFLLVSVLTAMFGCLILSSTNNRFGAWSGLLFAGCGFAGIYPLVLEKIGYRFPSFRPALFNGILAVAFTGGLLANASLGYLAAWLGIGVVMWLPMAGSVMVFVLLLLIWLEAKLSGHPVQGASAQL